MKLIKRLMKEEGQGLVEYALIVGLIALVAVAAIIASGNALSNGWNGIQNSLESFL